MRLLRFSVNPCTCRMLVVAVLIICALLTVTTAAENESSKRVADLIYVPIQSHRACFRVLNATHALGCQSDKRGNVGVVFLIEQPSDFSEIENDKFGYGPYIVALDWSLTSDRELMKQLRENKNVAGVLTLFKNDATTLAAQSDDLACPNEHASSNLYSTKKQKCGSTVGWNTPGIGNWMFEWEKPVILVTDKDDIQKIEQLCWHGHNKGNMSESSAVLCAAKLSSFMNAAVDTPTCIRRNSVFGAMFSVTMAVRRCDPIGENTMSVFAPSIEPQTVIDKNSVMMLIARMDSITMYDSVSPGTDSALTGVITLLSMLHVLGKQRERERAKQMADKSGRTLVFTFLNAESFDYTGSTRLIYDMGRGRYPLMGKNVQIDLSKIGHVLEVNQLGSVNAGQHFAMHVDQTSYNQTDAKVDPIFDEIKKQLTGSGYGLEWAPKVAGYGYVLPPSSIHSFLKPGRNMSHGLITAYKASFENQHYNSVGDTAKRYPDVDSLAKALTAMANGLLAVCAHWLQPGVGVDTWKVLEEDVKRLITCYIKSKNYVDSKEQCAEFAAIFSTTDEMIQEIKERYRDIPDARTYPQPFNTVSLGKFMTEQMLAAYTGEVVENVTSIDSCGELNKHATTWTYYFLNNSISNPTQATNISKFQCYRAPIVQTDGGSPAFLAENENYDFASNQYPAWTESRWSGTTVQLFLMPPSYFGWVMFIFGLLIGVISYFVVWFFDTRSSILFAPHTGEGVM